MKEIVSLSGDLYPEMHDCPVEENSCDVAMFSGRAQIIRIGPLK